MPYLGTATIEPAEGLERGTAVKLHLKKGLEEFTDFFLLCSGSNQRQVKAIADAVEEALRATKIRPAHIEGYDRAEWILLDFFSFIVHVFTPQTRAFYSLERLWGDAERIEMSDTPPAAPVS